MELIPGLNNDLALESLIRVPFGSFGSLFRVNKAWNTELRRQYFHRRRQLLGLTRAHFVLALMAYPDPNPSPRNESDPSYWLVAFDPESESWTQLPPAPRLPFKSLECCRVAGVGSDIFVVTGGRIGHRKDITNVVQIFDSLTGQWRFGAEMPGPGRVMFGLAGDPVGRTVLVAGGEVSEKMTRSFYWSEYVSKPTKSSMLYDVAKDTWVALDDMERARRECDVVFHGGSFHVINMIGSSHMLAPCAESLDPDTWQWGPGDERFMDIPNSDVYDKCWAMEEEEGDVYRVRPRSGADVVEVRRSGSGEWRVVAQLPMEIAKISCLMTWKDKMVVIGGPFSSSVMQHDAYVLDLRVYEWRKKSLFEEDFSFAEVVSYCRMDL